MAAHLGYSIRQTIPHVYFSRPGATHQCGKESSSSPQVQRPRNCHTPPFNNEQHVGRGKSAGCRHSSRCRGEVYSRAGTGVQVPSNGDTQPQIQSQISSQPLLQPEIKLRTAQEISASVAMLRTAITVATVEYSRQDDPGAPYTHPDGVWKIGSQRESEFKSNVKALELIEFG